MQTITHLPQIFRSVSNGRSSVASEKLTEAGVRFLADLLDQEHRGQLRPVYDGLGALMGSGKSLRTGDGAQLAVARKLSKDGFIRLVGGFSNSNRFAIPTEKGRAAILKAKAS